MLGESGLDCLEAGGVILAVRVQDVLGCDAEGCEAVKNGDIETALMVQGYCDDIRVLC